MPTTSQNKLLQEKLLLVNEKLVNVFEELQQVQKFHKNLSTFFSELREKIADVPTQTVVVDEYLKYNIDKTVSKGIKSLEQFSVFFT